MYDGIVNGNTAGVGKAFIVFKRREGIATNDKVFRSLIHLECGNTGLKYGSHVSKCFTYQPAAFTNELYFFFGLVMDHLFFFSKRKPVNFVDRFIIISITAIILYSCRRLSSLY